MTRMPSAEAATKEVQANHRQGATHRSISEARRATSRRLDLLFAARTTAAVRHRCGGKSVLSRGRSARYFGTRRQYPECNWQSIGLAARFGGRPHRRASRSLSDGSFSPNKLTGGSTILAWDGTTAASGLRRAIPRRQGLDAPAPGAPGINAVEPAGGKFPAAARSVGAPTSLVRMVQMTVIQHTRPRV
jgi:hypothetical protein